MAEHFLNIKAYRYLWASVVFTLAFVLVYFLDDPIHGPNGGTWLGYTLGTVSFFLILFLMWFGVRKRQYSRAYGSVKAWLSAHVYFGLALVILTTLHTGFQLGWNVHTLAYALLMLDVISGIVGVVLYRRIPVLLSDNMGDMTREQLIQQMRDIDRQLLAMANSIDDDTHKLVLQSIQNTIIGGKLRTMLKPLWHQCRGLMSLIHRLIDRIKTEEHSLHMAFMMETQNFGEISLAQKQGHKTGLVNRLLDLLSQKDRVVDHINRDIRYKAWLDVWLYVHVPLSFAVLALVMVHIFSVFIYW